MKWVGTVRMQSNRAQKRAKDVESGLIQQECGPIEPKRGKDVESGLAQQECWLVEPKRGKDVESGLVGASARKPMGSPWETKK